MALEIREIKQNLVKIVQIEERQLNQKEALTRIGTVLDRLEADIEGIKSDIALYKVDQGKEVSTIKAAVNQITARIAIAATILATIITGAVMLALEHLFNNPAKQQAAIEFLEFLTRAIA